MEKKTQRDFRKPGVKPPRKGVEKDIKEIIPKVLKDTYEELHIIEEGFEKVIAINRTAKVTKGGKKLSFSALVVVGDKRGSVGCGYSKANEVPDAIRKAINTAKKNTIKVPLKGTTIPHEVTGRFGAAIVLLKPAAEGTGVIAGNVVRAVCEAAGIKDVLTKCLKSQTAINVVKATLDGLMQLRTKNELLETKAENA